MTKKSHLSKVIEREKSDSATVTRDHATIIICSHPNTNGSREELVSAVLPVGSPVRRRRVYVIRSGAVGTAGIAKDGTTVLPTDLSECQAVVAFKTHVAQRLSAAFAPGTEVRGVPPRLPPGGKEHLGTVLEPTDPRAWANTLAFPDRTPSREEVVAHVSQPHIKAFMSSVPVLWTFGKVYWESPTSIAPTKPIFVVQERKVNR